MAEKTRFIHPRYSNFTVHLCGHARTIMFQDNAYETDDPLEIEELRGTDGVLEAGNDDLNAQKEVARKGEDALEWEERKNQDGQTLETRPFIKGKGGRRSALNVT